LLLEVLVDVVDAAAVLGQAELGAADREALGRSARWVGLQAPQDHPLCRPRRRDQTSFQESEGEPGDGSSHPIEALLQSSGSYTPDL